MHVEDLADAENRISILMGDDVEPRKEWIDTNVSFADEDDYRDQGGVHDGHSLKNKVEQFVEEKIIQGNLEDLIGDRFGNTPNTSSRTAPCPTSATG
ncbi:MAG: hypothetical protein MZU97_11860 [Bacillus subtilis]|nr:hypothetical protein [Bacillus subtilis]